MPNHTITCGKRKTVLMIVATDADTGQRIAVPSLVFIVAKLAFAICAGWNRGKSC